jgi:predicted TIM-barrel fold metal-dependent hydrolase
VLPDRGSAELDGMQRLAEELNIDAWKVYTQFGGWWLDDSNGIAFIEKARSLGIKRICAHKGLTLPLPGFDPNYANSSDLVKAAKMFPDVSFVVYHSNYETDITEGPYNGTDRKGVDILIGAMGDQGLGAGSNVYAELGSTWRNVMNDTTQASHVLGKLLQTFGEDRILWGTDSIWYGSPQDQIDAFRAFQIEAGLQGTYGTISETAKAKILGLNAANLYGVDPEATLCEIAEDDITARKMELPDRPAPRLRNLGPRSRRELFAFLRQRGDTPG